MRHLLPVLLMLLVGMATAQVEIDNGPTPPLGGTNLRALQGEAPLLTDPGQGSEEDFVPEEPVMVQENPNRVADFLAYQDHFAGFGAQPEALESYLDEGGMAALQASLTAYYRYRESGYLHRRAVFDWQLFSSKVIFYIVIALVLLGVYFSWLQFMAEHRRATKPPPGPGPETEAGQKGEEAPRRGLFTTFKAGSGGLEVSSSVLGIVILVISLAFFYLYLTHVYPITEIF
jgi:hypothetical protein